MMLTTETDENVKAEAPAAAPPSADASAAPAPAPKKKGKGKAVLLVLSGLILAAAAAFWFIVLNPYRTAGKAMESGDYGKAAELLEKIGFFKDSEALRDEALTKVAGTAIGEGRYDEAAAALEKTGDAALAKETVYQSYLAALEADPGAVREILERFGAYAEPLSRYEEPARSRMDALLSGGEDEKALALYAAVGKLGAEGILRDAAEKEIRARLAAGDAARASRIVTRVGEVIDVSGPVREKIEELRTAGDPDGALALLEEMDGSHADYQQEAYLIAYEYATLERYEEAIGIYETLGDYKESRTFLREIKYRLLVSQINEAGSLLPEDFVRFWQYLQDLEDHEQAGALRKTILRGWVEASVLSEDPLAYAEALEGAGLTEEEKAEALRFVMEETPPMVTRNDQNFVVYTNAEKLKAVLKVTEIMAAGSDAADVKGFEHFVAYLVSRDKKDMPSVGDLRAIWDIRPELADFCFSDDPMMYFLRGSWRDRESGIVALKVSLSSSGVLSVQYNLSMPESGNAFQASFGGLNVIINKRESARVCTISITDADHVELFNMNNGKFYQLTREGE